MGPRNPLPPLPPCQIGLNRKECTIGPGMRSYEKEFLLVLRNKHPHTSFLMTRRTGPVSLPFPRLPFPTRESLRTEAGVFSLKLASSMSSDAQLDSKLQYEKMFNIAIDQTKPATCSVDLQKLNV